MKEFLSSGPVAVGPVTFIGHLYLTKSLDWVLALCPSLICSFDWARCCLMDPEMGLDQFWSNHPPITKNGEGSSLRNHRSNVPPVAVHFRIVLSSETSAVTWLYKLKDSSSTET